MTAKRRSTAPPRCEVCKGTYAYLYRNGNKYIHEECRKGQVDAAAEPKVSPNRAVVIQADGKEKAVKNLGWLLRNWKSVERFEIKPPPAGTVFTHEALMIAHCRDGVRYETLWGSKTVLLDWIHRPIFRGIPVDWFGESRKASPRRGPSPTAKCPKCNTPLRPAHGMRGTYVCPTRDCQGGFYRPSSRSPKRGGKPRYFYIEVSHLGPSAVAIDYKGASVNLINGDRKETVESIRRAAHKHWPGLPEHPAPARSPLTRAVTRPFKKLGRAIKRVWSR